MQEHVNMERAGWVKQRPISAGLFCKWRRPAVIRQMFPSSQKLKYSPRPALDSLTPGQSDTLYWPLIGRGWSRDLNTGLWLVSPGTRHHVLTCPLQWEEDVKCCKVLKFCRTLHILHINTGLAKEIGISFYISTDFKTLALLFCKGSIALSWSSFITIIEHWEGSSDYMINLEDFLLHNVYWERYI